MNQLKEINSSEFLVPLASGGDPQFPFKIKMSGEEVQGNSGSFRHFLSEVVAELHSSSLPILTPNLGSSTYKGYHFLSPGQSTAKLQPMLKFLGQLLGVTLRAGIPIPLRLMPTFWKSLLLEKFCDEDLNRYDHHTYAYIESIANIHDKDMFDQFLEENHYPKFVYPSLSGKEDILCEHGSETYLSFENKLDYVDSIKTFRLQEMESSDRMRQIRAGLATIVQIEYVLLLFNPSELERRVCGTDHVSLPCLQRFTIYQAGLKEEDEHIRHFWSALESFSHRQLQRFVKFACNQERVPMDFVPPFPMKIAPPDRRLDDPDGQLIRAETCMFLIKLPFYSSYEVMREKLIFSISNAYDPLSG